MSILLERAEDLDYNALKTLEVQNQYNIDYLHYFITQSSFNQPVKFCVGPKGIGKTLSIMKALNKCICEDYEIFPCMFQFRSRGKIRLIEPLRIASREEWGERLPHYGETGGDTVRLMEKSSVIIVDDIHYMCEAVLEGKLPKSEVISLLNTVLELSERGKKLLLISEDILSGYAIKLKWNEFNDLLPRFGMRIPNIDGEYAPSGDLDYLRLFEVNGLTNEEFCNLQNIYGVNLDSDVMSLVYHISNLPRAYIKFCNLFHPQNRVTLEDVRSFISRNLMLYRDQLKSRMDKRFVTRKLRQIQEFEWDHKTPPNDVVEIKMKLASGELDYLAHMINFTEMESPLIRTARLLNDIVIIAYIGYRDYILTNTGENDNQTNLDRNYLLLTIHLNNELRKLFNYKPANTCLYVTESVLKDWESSWLGKAKDPYSEWGNLMSRLRWAERNLCHDMRIADGLFPREDSLKRNLAITYYENPTISKWLKNFLEEWNIFRNLSINDLDNYIKVGFKIFNRSLIDFFHPLISEYPTLKLLDLDKLVEVYSGTSFDLFFGNEPIKRLE